MSKKLDLHGIKHEDVDRIVENFVLLNNPPLEIITGNSQEMSEMVRKILVKHNLYFEHWSSAIWKIL
jgi:hypothetical protein|tara:strand:- start:45 stop:245 length:201 start_codon:yes stop_codon:yes gene_type:complete